MCMYIYIYNIYTYMTYKQQASKFMCGPRSSGTQNHRTEALHNLFCVIYYYQLSICEKCFLHNMNAVRKQHAAVCATWITCWASKEQMHPAQVLTNNKTTLNSAKLIGFKYLVRESESRSHSSCTGRQERDLCLQGFIAHCNFTTTKTASNHNINRCTGILYIVVACISINDQMLRMPRGACMTGSTRSLCSI